jgi:hypothetical protein
MTASEREESRQVLGNRGSVCLRALLAGALATCALLAAAATAYASSQPTVSSVKPGAGPATGGTRVTIYGSGYTEVTAVDFGANPAVGFTVESAGRITATSPAGRGTVHVTVTTRAGASAANSVDHFAYLPVVRGVSPRSGPVGGGTVVTITGVGLGEATGVAFGSAGATGIEVTSDTSITATSPPNSAGKVHVRVAAPAGTSRTSPNDTFQYTPTVTSVDPDAGSVAGGTSVTIKGTGFATGAGATLVKFGPARGLSVACASTTECTAVSPPMAPKVEGGAVHVGVTVHSVVSPASPADEFHYHGIVLTYGTRPNEGSPLPVGASLQLRDVLAGGEQLCFPHVEAAVAENGGEPAIAAFSVAEYGSCEPRAWTGALPGHFLLHIGSTGSATIRGAMGVTSPSGCFYEGDELTGGLEEEYGYLVVHLGGSFTNPAAPRWEAEIATLVDEVATAEQAVSEEEAQVRATQLQIEEDEARVLELEETGESPEELESLRTQLAALRQELAKLQTKLAESRQTLARLERRLSGTERRLSECGKDTGVGMTIEDEAVGVRKLG